MPNPLDRERSAYLQSAKDQPVQWHPWGADAFERARDEDKPILLDIGAVWCHWCHVMDHESYEDPAIAELLNDQWVCIKVDRDERPDVDARYQRAVQALTGQGGWPLTAFLTPDGDVFYAGTYFPPDDRFGRPGFRSVLLSLARVYREQRDHVHAQATEIVQHLETRAAEVKPGDPSVDTLVGATNGISRLFDFRHGGFGSEPKFPHPGACEFLLARWFDTGEEALREMVERTLVAMGRGGIRDHVGGGFHRYSVDARWIVPHFEKMLYDNAELLKAYLSALSASSDEGPDAAGRLYREVVEGILHWMEAEMIEAEGGYRASQDADVSPGDDGDYFTWTAEEARAALSPNDFAVLARYYDIGKRGEMHHNPRKNVLWIDQSAQDIAAEIGLSAEEVEARLASGRRSLARARGERPAPFIDPTLYTAWNGMMASAMLAATDLVPRPALRDHAILTLERLFSAAAATDDGLELPHAIGSSVTGILDDQVQCAQAALDVFERSGASTWLERAAAVMTHVWSAYQSSDGGLRDTRRDRPGEGFLSQELVPLQDAPTPSPNGTAAIVLSRLAELTGEERWRSRRDALLGSLAGAAAELSIHGATLLRGIDWAVAPVTHVVIVGRGDAVTQELGRVAHATYRPRKVVRHLMPDAPAEGLPVHLAAMLDGTFPRAYVCTGARCAAPMSTPEELVTALRSFGRPTDPKSTPRKPS
jgi:uncharacterized protein YyaL (SSP411 family)